MARDILITVAGKTDPIRSFHDGAIMHIVRNYRPEVVVLVLTEEIGRDESVYHHNERAICSLNTGCKIEPIYTGIENPQSYDDFAVAFLKICNEMRCKYPEHRILLNITSGTPQMQTAFCMIAISDPMKYLPVQVETPERKSNSNEVFNPIKDDLDDWLSTNLDNEPGSLSRCKEPRLINFRRPILQFQIESLIFNYDYAGALQLYRESQVNFSKKVGLLLEHAEKRLNLEMTEAERLVRGLDLEAKLYPSKRRDIVQLLEYYNSMCVKQKRGELNDFIIRLEVLATFLGKYILEKNMKVSLKDITFNRFFKDNKRVIMKWDQQKCRDKMPGFEKYLDEFFSDSFRWGSDVNALSIIHAVHFLSNIKLELEGYRDCTKEMLKWTELTRGVRNPAAHSIIAVVDESIKEIYGGSSKKLCNNIRVVMEKAFGNEVKNDAFSIYEIINKEIQYELEKE